MAKLNTLKVVKGGNGADTIMTTTDTDGTSTMQCRKTATVMTIEPN